MDKKYIVIESEGFGVMESPITEVFRSEFNNKEDAECFLKNYRKDNGLSWCNWETPYTYKIIEQNGK